MLKFSEYKKEQESYMIREINKVVSLLEDDIDTFIIQNAISHTNIMSMNNDDVRFYGSIYDFKNKYDENLAYEAIIIIKEKYEKNGWEFINIVGNGGRCIGVKVPE